MTSVPLRGAHESLANVIVTQRLSEPQLQFDYENRRAVHVNPYYGLRDFGPYDAAERRRAGVAPTRVVIVGLAAKETAIENVVAGLNASKLRGLQAVFPLEFVDRILVPSVGHLNQEAAAYQRSIEEWFAETPYRRDVDLAIVLHSNESVYKGVSPYYSAKAAFMRRGVPTQHGPIPI